MAQTVIGFFDDASEAQRAVEKLQSSGIGRDRVDVSRGSGGASTAGSSTVGVNPVSGSPKDDNSVSRTADDRTVDGEGRNTNVFTDFFNNLFGGSDDKGDAERYSKVAQGSNSIVTVHAQSQEEAERAADILDECGAIDVEERAARFSGNSSDPRQGTEDRGGLVIPRVEENLNVGKRTEETGGVRVRSRIVERPVEEHVRLREEHINVERQAVNRPLSTNDARGFEEKEIELTERAEVPVINKEARVVEEIKLSKEVTERNETINDTVRNTEIDIDKTGEENRRSSDDGPLDRGFNK